MLGILVYSEFEENTERPVKHLCCNVFVNEPWQIYDELFYSEPFETITYLDSLYIQNLSIFRAQDI